MCVFSKMNYSRKAKRVGDITFLCLVISHRKKKKEIREKTTLLTLPISWEKLYKEWVLFLSMGSQGHARFADGNDFTRRFDGVVVITSASHAEGREFKPRSNLSFFLPRSPRDFHHVARTPVIPVRVSNDVFRTANIQILYFLSYKKTFGLSDKS